jgi:hypothetical protein
MELAGDNVDWVAGFEDECWWSRVAQPALHSFSEAGEPLRLVEQSVAKDDPVIRKPFPATGYICPSSNRRGCALWTAVP